MVRTLRAIFDGTVLRPDEPVDLKPNTRVVVTIETEESVPTVDEQDYPLTSIGRLATDMGVTDLSVRHREYAHGSLEVNSVEP